MNSATETLQQASDTEASPALKRKKADADRQRELEVRFERIELAIAELCRLLTQCEPRAITKPLYEPDLLGASEYEGGAGKPNLAAILRKPLTDDV